MADRKPAGLPIDKPRRFQVKVVDGIIESLRQDIVLGRLPRGERMPSERQLAEQYSVSQPTMREAMRALETLGLVEGHKGSGSYIRGHGDYAVASALQTFLQLESVGIMEVLAVRQILGRDSVQLAMLRADAAAIAAIERAFEELEHVESAADVDEVMRRIVDFQRAVSAAADNALLHSLEVFLATLLIAVQAKALRKRGVNFWRQRASEFQDDRRAILDAIRTKSRKDVVIAMNRYFEDQRARFEQDDALRDLKLSDPRLVTAIAEMVLRLKSTT